MNERARIRTIAPRLALIGFTLALLTNAGCISGEPNETLFTLANDLARQLATFCLL